MAEASRRAEHVAAVLEAVVLMSRALDTGQRVPFHGQDLSRTQLQALFTLARGRRPVTPGRLALSLGVTAGAVTQLVDGLEGGGLVERVPNPVDARSSVLQLTTDAAAEVERFEHATVERLLPRFDALTEDEVQALAALLGRITEQP